MAHTTPDHKHRPGGVAHRGVGPVNVAVQELEPVGELMVDLQGGGHSQQHQEAEVDERVHHPGCGLPQQGAHVDAGSEVGHAVLGVVHRRAAVVGPAPLPVLHPVGEQDRPVHQQHGDDRVEGDLQRGGNVAEHLAGDRAVVVEAGDAGHDARQGGEQRDGHAEGDDDVMGPDPGPHDGATLLAEPAPGH